MLFLLWIMVYFIFGENVLFFTYVYGRFGKC